MEDNKGINVMVLKKFMDDHDVSFEDMRSLLAEVSPPDLTINNVINLMESKPYFEEEEDEKERESKYTPPDKTSGPTRSINGKDVSPEELQKLVEKKKNWKPDKDRYEKYNHNGIDVWVRKDLKGQHKEYGLCWSCIKFKNNEYLDRVMKEGFAIPWQDRCEKPTDLWVEKVAGAEGCPIANGLYEYCCKYGTIALVWECPEFEDSSETAEAFNIPVTGEYFDDNERSEIG